MELGALALSFFIASVNVYIAKKRGRSLILWFLLGIFFGVLATLFLLILPTVSKVTEEVAVKDGKNLENEDHNEITSSDWFYLDKERKEKGEISFPELKKCWEDREINLESYVWAEGMKDWKQISQIPKLKHMLTSADA